MPETDYVSLLRKGDQQGLNLCYKEYYKPLLVSLRSRQIPLPDAQELIHDAFVMLWGLRNTIQSKQHLKALLYQNLKWAIRDFTKRHATANKVFNHNLLVENIEAEDSTSLQYLLEVEEHVHLVFIAINSLPPHLSRVILLRAEGYKGDEISKILEISHKTVRTAIFDARKRLGKIIPDHWLSE